MNRRSTLIGAIVLAFAATSGPGVRGAAQEKHLDVPYVPTRYPVVDEMLRMAELTGNDILYDLGCGDGRIVIAAAQKYGARAVGVDIDPDRIAECREKAAEAGVEDKVRFIEGDLFKADVRDATVVSLYLLTSVNLKLRPRLLSELAPGTRIVSHNFAMDAWKPDATSEIKVDGRTHTVYLWTVPANVGGKWTWTIGEPAGTWEMTLDQSFQFAVGAVTFNGIPLAVRTIEVRGKVVRATADWPAEPGTSVVFEGKAADHSLRGTARFKTPGGEREWKWEASRDPMTSKPLDAATDGGFRYDRGIVHPAENPKRP
jgi:SAM-dependent methyltransferase